MPLNEGIRTLTAGEALVPNRRVKLKSGTVTTPPEVEYADAGEQHIGSTEIKSDNGVAVTVRLRNQSGTRMVTAGAAFAVGAALYGAIDGKVSGAVSGSAIGIALEAATADGDIVEVIDNNAGF